jgi:2-(1,2-epoxy-1,2-dihydrophenyl)acetyl-CoA isomerase
MAAMRASSDERECAPSSEIASATTCRPPCYRHCPASQRRTKVRVAVTSHIVTDVLLVERADGVATMTMNRPESMNALSIALKEALVSAVEELAADESVRAVVLTGAGRAFCAGQDLREHVSALESADTAPLSTVIEHYNPITAGLATMPKPVIAAVNGVAAGAGAGFAMACDFRIAAKSASFLLAFANIGLTLDSGVSWTLPRLIGSARATAMALLAEPVGAEAALEMGLVNAVAEDDRALAAAHELAARLAAGPTLAYAAIKESIAYAASSSLIGALAKEAELQVVAGATADHQDASAAFVAKQKPVFHGR